MDFLRRMANGERRTRNRFIEVASRCGGAVARRHVMRYFPHASVRQRQRRFSTATYGTLQGFG
jgi:hypothetical protein